MKRYLLRLRVTHPDGSPVFAEVKYFNGVASIRIRNLKKLKDDEYVKDGRISINNIGTKQFTEVLNKLTTYLETKMLEIMNEPKGEKSENRNPSDGSAHDSRGDAKSNTSGGIEETKARGSSSVRPSSRRNKSTEDSREGAEDSEVAESSDSSISGSSEDGD